MNNLAAPAKHFVGIVACGAVLDSVFTMARPQLARRTRLPHLAIALSIMVVMTVLFSAVPQPAPVDNFYEAYAGSRPATAYSLTFTVYLGIAMAVASWLFLAYSQHAGSRALRTGLRFLGAGTTVGVPYSLFRATDLMAGLRHVQFPLSPVHAN